VSVERRAVRNARTAWRVRWREGGHNRVRHFDRKRDAESFDAEIRRRKRLGELGLLEAGRETLADFAREWFERYARPKLARRTLEGYAVLFDAYLLPRLGGFALRELNPEIVQRLRADLASEGKGDATIRKTLVLLQGILERAVEWERIPRNPVKTVDKPSQKRKRAVRPLAPAEIERLRNVLGQRDRTLVSVLAYAGVRPGEALALTWADVGERTLLVEKALEVDGEAKDTKTSRWRTVELLAPLAQDLNEWRLVSGRPADAALLFPASHGDLERVRLPQLAGARLHPGRAGGGARRPSRALRPPPWLCLAPLRRGSKPG
jgi:integrase